MRLPCLPLLSSTSLFLTFLLLCSYALAQNPKLPALTDTTADGKSPTTTTAKAAPPKPTTEPAAKTPDTTKTTESPTTTQKAAKASDTAAAETGLPALTTTSASDDGLITGLPRLENYPTPIVPPTANAPFMQKSNLPEGTVFICVGAALAFMGFIVIAWRGLVAWSLHRSVRRAAIAQSKKHGREKARYIRRNSKAPFYNPGPGSTLSLDQLGTNGRSGTTSSVPARESLFFSPTAGGGSQMPGPRGTGYLPAGFYAAGNSALGGGSGMAHIGGGSSNLGNQNSRYTRARSMGPSPPLSPSLPPSRGEDVSLRRPSTAGLTLHASNSSLNLSAPHARAPSAYLDDLFENHPPGPENAGRGRS